MQLRRCLTVDAGHAADHVIGVVVSGAGGAMADGQVAASCDVVAVLGDDPVRVFLIRDEMQDVRAHHRYRLRQIKQAEKFRALQDHGRLAQVGVHHGDLLALDEQRLTMGPDHRVVVDVDHPRVRSDPLGHLVHVGLSGKTAAKVDELPDACFLSEKADRPADERPVIPHYPRHVRQGQDKLLGRLAVNGEIVLAAEQVIVDPGDVRPRCINAARSRVLRRHIA